MPLAIIISKIVCVMTSWANDAGSAFCKFPAGLSAGGAFMGAEAWQSGLLHRAYPSVGNFAVALIWSPYVLPLASRFRERDLRTLFIFGVAFLVPGMAWSLALD